MTTWAIGAQFGGAFEVHQVLDLWGDTLSQVRVSWTQHAADALFGQRSHDIKLLNYNLWAGKNLHVFSHMHGNLDRWQIWPSCMHATIRRQFIRLHRTIMRGLLEPWYQHVRREEGWISTQEILKQARPTATVRNLQSYNYHNNSRTWIYEVALFLKFIVHNHMQQLVAIYIYGFVRY